MGKGPVVSPIAVMTGGRSCGGMMMMVLAMVLLTMIYAAATLVVMVEAVMFLGLEVMMMLTLVLAVTGDGEGVSHVLRFGGSDAAAADVGNGMRVDDSDTVLVLAVVVMVLSVVL